MFELDEHDKLQFSHNPFSMPQGGLDALNNEDPLSILAYQYDLVCNGVELSSGAVRNHNIEIMLKAFEMAGYTEEEVKTKFGALYTAFQFGAPPHAGIAPGFDRMLMLLTDSDTIRDVIAFPLNSKAQDLMMGAPSNVKYDQLRDVHIKVDIKEKIRKILCNNAWDFSYFKAFIMPTNPDKTNIVVINITNIAKPNFIL